VLTFAFGLEETVEAVRNCEASREVSAIAGSILDVEKRSQGRKAKVWETQDVAPTRGFNGDGLDGKEGQMIGNERRERRDDEEL